MDYSPLVSQIPIMETVPESRTRARTPNDPQLENLAQKEADAQRIEKENLLLEARIKDSAIKNLHHVRTGINELYAKLRKLPDDAPPAQLTPGLTARLSARGLRITYASRRDRIDIKYAPRPLERILSGTTQRLRISYHTHEAPTRMENWRSSCVEGVPFTLKNVVETSILGVTFAGLGSLVGIATDVIIHDTISNSYNGLGATYLFAGVAMIGVARLSFGYNAKNYFKRQRLCREEQKADRESRRTWTDPESVLTDAERALPALRLVASTLQLAHEAVHKHAHGDGWRDAMTGEFDARGSIARYSAAQERNRQLKRLIGEAGDGTLAKR